MNSFGARNLLEEEKRKIKRRKFLSFLLFYLRFMGIFNSFFKIKKRFGDFLGQGKQKVTNCNFLSQNIPPTLLSFSHGHFSTTRGHPLLSMCQTHTCTNYTKPPIKKKISLCIIPTCNLRNRCYNES